MSATQNRSREFERHRRRLFAIADASAELSSSLSIAFLVMLGQLSPDERSAFLLHEVLDSEYAEIAQILGRSEAACRQIVSRARKRLRDQRPRVQASDTARRSVLERFTHAIQAQDKAALLDVYAVLNPNKLAARPVIVHV